MLSQELFSLVKDVLSPRNPAQALFEDCLVHDRARPLLLIVDRTNDLFPMLQHNSTYLVSCTTLDIVFFFIVLMFPYELNFHHFQNK
jgi:hypothetical protein